MTRSTTAARPHPRASRLLCCLLLALAVPAAATLPARAQLLCTTDVDGPDDEPGQKDLNRMCVDFSPASGDVRTTWAWDELAVSGGSTIDGCSLYDVNENGNADFAVCIAAQFPDAAIAFTVLVWECSDKRSDRCSAPTTLLLDTDPATPEGPPASACAVAVQPGADPFSGVPSHESAEGDPTSDDDLVADCTIDFADLGGVSGVRFLNVCAYPSGPPNTDPSDCVAAPDSYFIMIEKEAEPNVPHVFNFDLTDELGLQETSITGSGMSGRMAALGTATIVEEIPGVWELRAVDCTDGSTTYGSDLFEGSTLIGVQGITAVAGTDVVCTFNDVNVAIPIELTSIEAVLAGDEAVELVWETATELNNAGFEVLVRRPGRPDFEPEPAAFVEGHGTSLVARRYRHRLTGLAPGAYAFRLRQVDFDGAYAYSPTVEVVVPFARAYLLQDVYPNPFRAEARVQFGVREATPVRVALHDAAGRLVRVLYEGTPEAGGAQSLRIRGEGLAGGVYLVRMTGPDFVDLRTVMLVR